MKFFRIDLLTLLISLFILNSCKNQDSIGLNQTSGLEITGSLRDTATVFTNTTTDDSVFSSALQKTPLGYFNDAEIGTTRANLITDIGLPSSTAYTVPTGDITIDSAVIVLKYAAGFYGDSLTSKYKVNVYQLDKERPLTTQGYYDNKVWSYNANRLLGTASFYSRSHDSLRIKDIVSGGPDTFKKVPPQIRIPLDTSFIRSILFGAPASQLSSNLVFKNTVKGFFITIDSTQSTGTGGTFMINNPLDSTLQVYIRVKNGTTIDTTMVPMPVTAHVSQIKHVYKQAVLDAIARNHTNEVNNTHTSDKVMYMQGLAGLRGKISFPYIQQLFKDIGNDKVVVNRAELVITRVPGSDIPSYLTPLRRLSLYRYDIAHQRTSVEDASASDVRFLGGAVFGGFYNSLQKEYHFLLTAYIQDLINGRTIDYGTYLAPIDDATISTVATAATPQVEGRTIAVGDDPSSQYRIKLNVIYTKINK